MELPSPLLQLVEAASPLVDTTPLAQALDHLRQPWTVAVIGRVGVGKSSLVNAAAGRKVRAVGLGGITAQTEAVAMDGMEVVDTAGIDEEARALASLDALLPRADEVIWVIDGLQPLTASERRVVELTLPADILLHVVLSRRDLVPDEEAAWILDRARVLTRPHAPASLHHLDLRRPPSPLPAPLLTPQPLGPRRSRLVQRAIDAVRDALERLPETLSTGDLLRAARERWARVVRDAEGQIERALSSGEVDTATLAVARLAHMGPQARVRFLEALAVEPPLAPLAERAGDLDMPLPEGPDATPVQQMITALGGVMGARRALRAGAARWLAEGEIALMDWFAEQEGLDQPYQIRRRAHEALQAAEALLERGSAPSGPTVAEVGEVG